MIFPVSYKKHALRKKGAPYVFFPHTERLFSAIFFRAWLFLYKLVRFLIVLIVDERQFFPQIGFLCLHGRAEFCERRVKISLTAY